MSFGVVWFMFDDKVIARGSTSDVVVPAEGAEIEMVEHGKRKKTFRVASIRHRVSFSRVAGSASSEVFVILERMKRKRAALRSTTATSAPPSATGDR